MRKYLSILGAVFLLLSCRVNKKVAQYPPEKLVPTEKSLLWRISGNGLKEASYLFGTIHLIPKDEFSFNSATLEALRKTKRMAFEIDMKEMTNLLTQISLMSKAFMPEGITLRTLLPPEDYALVRTKMDEKGLPLTLMEKLKPMFLSMMLGSEGDDDNPLVSRGGMTSVELELYKIARKQNMTTTGLETARYQMTIFDSIPYAAQAKILVEQLRSGENGSVSFAHMVELYRQQDIEALQSLVTAEGTTMKDYEDYLLNKRNRNWLTTMISLMQTRPTFFAVGAGHLGGKQGIIALLRMQGFFVEPVSGN